MTKKKNSSDHLKERTRQLTEEITQHIQTKLELKKAGGNPNITREVIKNFIESIPVPVIIKDQQGRVLECNSAFIAVTGAARPDVMGKTAAAGMSREVVRTEETTDKQVLEKGKVCIYETRYPVKDGSERDMLITKTRLFLSPSGEHCTLTIANDITESKRMQELLNIQNTIEYLASVKKGLKKTLRNILQNLFKIYWVDACGIYLFDQKSRMLNLECHAGLSKEFAGLVQSYSEDSNQMKILLAKKPFFMSTSDMSEPIRMRNEKEGLLLTAAIPLINFENNEFIGNLNLASKTYDTITEEDKKSIGQIALRLSSLILYAQNQEKLKDYQSNLEQKIQEKTADLTAKVRLLKSKDKKIKQSENELIKLQDHLPIGIFSTNIKGEIKYCNKKFCKIFGCNSIRDFKKLPINDYFISGKTREDISKLITEKGELSGIEVQLKRVDHSAFWGLLRAGIVRDANGDPYQIEGLLEDITEIKNTKRELELSHQKIRKNEEKYRNLQDNIPIGVYSSDVNGNLLHVNKQSVKMFRYDSLKEMMEVPLRELYANAEDRAKLVEILLREGRLNDAEVLLKRKDHSNFWGLISARTVFDETGKPLHFDGIVQDISEIKKTKKELEEANIRISTINRSLEEKISEALQKQETQHALLIQKSKLESLGELSAGIAHEINQPLGVMTLTLENLKSKLAATTDESDYLEGKFESITKNIRRIREIIDHIRTFSRDQESFVLDKIDVNKIVRRTLSLIGAQYQNHNIHVRLELQENLGFTVGSNFKLEQVILNLLSNSKYALEEKGVYMNENEYVKEILIKTESTPNKIILHVNDNGEGIKPEHLHRLFDPFFTTKPEGFGTGLGLSIVYGIILNMRGEIIVNSKEKSFTKFKIMLPRFPEKN